MFDFSYLSSLRTCKVKQSRESDKLKVISELKIGRAKNIFRSSFLIFKLDASSLYNSQ